MIPDLPHLLCPTPANTWAASHGGADRNQRETYVIFLPAYINANQQQSWIPSQSSNWSITDCVTFQTEKDKREITAKIIGLLLELAYSPNGFSKYDQVGKQMTAGVKFYLPSPTVTESIPTAACPDGQRSTSRSRKGWPRSAPPSHCQEPLYPYTQGHHRDLEIYHAESHSCSAAQLIKAGSPNGHNQAERATGTEVCDQPRDQDHPASGSKALQCPGDTMNTHLQVEGDKKAQWSRDLSTWNMCSKTTLGYVIAQFGPFTSVPATLSSSDALYTLGTALHFQQIATLSSLLQILPRIWKNNFQTFKANICTSHI